MLNAAGVKAALGNPGSTTGKGKASSVKSVEADKEKRDRAMAKAILDHLGMETEKYRLGYTKVKVQSISCTHSKGQFFKFYL